MSDIVADINIIHIFKVNVNKNSAKKHEKRSSLLTAAFKPLSVLRNIKLYFCVNFFLCFRCIYFCMS